MAVNRGCNSTLWGVVINSGSTENHLGLLLMGDVQTPAWRSYPCVRGLYLSKPAGQIHAREPLSHILSKQSLWPSGNLDLIKRVFYDLIGSDKRSGGMTRLTLGFLRENSDNSFQNEPTNETTKRFSLRVPGEIRRVVRMCLTTSPIANGSLETFLREKGNTVKFDVRHMSET
ncbi:hypothetical protein Bbelb_022900 [Branchiostoma belcheri]|nr:hypothetical protein Bbelb_022900 [Branchiostoma belcheri]